VPKVWKAPKRYLSHAQVRALAAAVEATGAGVQNGKALGYGTLVRLAAYTGLRWSELSGLQVRDVDLGRGRLAVTHTVVEVGGVLPEGDPKSYEVVRFLCDFLTSGGASWVARTSVPLGRGAMTRSASEGVEWAPLSRRAITGYAASTSVAGWPTMDSRPVGG
jgi:hypothetical protein